jgi:hypothetical protein
MRPVTTNRNGRSQPHAAERQKKDTRKVAGVTTREEAPIYAAVAGGRLRRGHGVVPGRAVATGSRPRGPASGLTGRRAERVMLDGLLTPVRTGESRALVVHGDPGVGTTALLEYLAGRAGGFRVLRVAGVQSEMELAFAGLHQLCALLLDRLGAVPEPQREALCTASGMSGGPAPDRFLVGLAVLGLLSEVAGQQPVLCLADGGLTILAAAAWVARLRAGPRKAAGAHVGPGIDVTAVEP